MAGTVRLNKVLRELNISLDRAVEFLETKGIEIEHRPTTKITDEVYTILSDEFQTDASKKVASKEVSEAKQKEKEALHIAREKELEAKRQKEVASSPEIVKASTKLSGPKKVGKIDLDMPKKTKPIKVEPVKKETVKEEPIVEAPKPVKKEIPVEKADSMTDNQIIAWVKDFFK